ncbi:MAG: hypothetical protein JXB49_09890 [Bacteroidales bacterium]|nr:hypothetical protein [Bacteroidales bacterium]
MKYIIIIVAVILLGDISISQTKNNKKIIKTDLITNMVVRYDPDILRIPGNTLPIGITSVMNNDEIIQTKGYLEGETKWRNYKVKVDGGYFLWGKIHLSWDDLYKKGEGFNVMIYSRKGKELLHSQRISYNYETDILLYTIGGFVKAPGFKVDLGYRVFYDNGVYLDKLFLAPQADCCGLNHKTYGGCICANTLIIDSDPLKINNHTVSVIGHLKKAPFICDTLHIILDYKASYKKHVSGFGGSDGSSGSSGVMGSTGFDGQDGGHGSDGCDGNRGPDLEVYADVYFDTIIHENLMCVNVKELETSKDFRYLLNTQGGRMSIISKGGDGGDGGNGGSGGSGGSGFNGEFITRKVQINDTTWVEETIQLPGGDGGNGGCGGNGGNGGYGGDGGNIYVYYTTFAAPYMHMLDIQSISGDGGSGGSGGSRGIGGSGGSGNPSGRSGSSGCSGSSGSSGKDGYHGEVYFYELSSE